MTTLADYPLVAVVVHQEGCGHCEEYLPRVRALAASACLPIVLVDGGQNRSVAAALQVEMTPTTIVLRSGHPVARGEGAISDEQFTAMIGQACAIQ